MNMIQEMECEIFRNKEACLSYWARHAQMRCSVEELTADECQKCGYLSVVGFCEPCERASHFKLYCTDSNAPNFRESLICEHCGLNNRQRFIAGFVKKYLKTGSQPVTEIYVYEQVTSFYKYMMTHFSQCNIIGSEFLGFDKNPGEVIKGIRHEDAMALTFEDRSIDLIISNDVFEHVPCLKKSLAEVSRVLRKGGILIFTIPFHTKNDMTISRACFESGRLIHLLPEQYHGNPVDNKGSLVFHDIGWDVLDMCKQAGFCDAYAVGYYNYLLGYIGDGLQLMFVAVK